jgi:hypothetical protein
MGFDNKCDGELRSCHSCILVNVDFIYLLWGSRTLLQEWLSYLDLGCAFAGMLLGRRFPEG